MINSYSGEGFHFKVKYQQQFLQGEFYECGLSNIPGKSDEDRFAIFTKDDASAAFGVFDGHGGKRAAEICSSVILSDTYDEIEKNRAVFDRNAKDKQEYGEADIEDALFCESTKRVAQQCHDTVVATDRSGTTSNLLFLSKKDNVVKAKCSNIGDSRCVVVKEHEGKWKAIAFSEDHCLTLTREITRISERLPVEWLPLPADPYKFDTNLDDTTNMPFPAYPPAVAMNRARAIVKLLEEIPSSTVPSIPTIPEDDQKLSENPSTPVSAKEGESKGSEMEPSSGIRHQALGQPGSESMPTSARDSFQEDGEPSELASFRPSEMRPSEMRPSERLSTQGSMTPRRELRKKNSVSLLRPFSNNRMLKAMGSFYSTASSQGRSTPGRSRQSEGSVDSQLTPKHKEKERRSLLKTLSGFGGVLSRRASFRGARENQLDITVHDNIADADAESNAAKAGKRNLTPEGQDNPASIPERRLDSKSPSIYSLDASLHSRTSNDGKRRSPFLTSGDPRVPSISPLLDNIPTVPISGDLALDITVHDTPRGEKDKEADRPQPPQPKILAPKAIRKDSQILYGELDIKGSTIFSGRSDEDLQYVVNMAPRRQVLKTLLQEDSVVISMSEVTESLINEIFTNLKPSRVTLHVRSSVVAQSASRTLSRTSTQAQNTLDTASNTLEVLNSLTSSADLELSETTLGQQQAETCCKRGYELSNYVINPNPKLPFRMNDSQKDSADSYVYSVCTPIIVGQGKGQALGKGFKDGDVIGVLQLIKEDVTVGDGSDEFSDEDRLVAVNTAKKLSRAMCKYIKNQRDVIDVKSIGSNSAIEFKSPRLHSKKKAETQSAEKKSPLLATVPTVDEIEKEKRSDDDKAGSTSSTQQIVLDEEAKENEVIEPAPSKLAFKQSFIGRRASPDGQLIGPVALFGVSNVSITMTRSIGDKYAARSCKCIPDITEVCVRSDEHARFIQASDGLWDVMTSQRAANLIRGVTDPVKASLLLAVKARSIREGRMMKIDDITVLVIDVHPQFRKATALSVASGCNCVII